MDIEGEIPIPITSTFVGGHGAHATSSPPHHSNGPPPPPLPLSTAGTEDHHQNTNTNTNTKKGLVVKYRECLKNHAASIGGSATDGCGEFMPGGEEGTLEALKCSACGCHRNFHRKEIEGESSCDCYHPLLKGRKQHLLGGQRGLLFSGAADDFGYSNSLIPRLPPQMIMPLGALHTSESDEMEGVVGGGGGFMARPPFLKKRFRTKFTAEQKEKMLHFAEKAGWKLQKQEESVVQQFCQEIGIKRRVLKVWMHNNKHNLAKKSSSLQLE
ncbi:zinc-finger homeodomain protein 4-like [Canna indica]|uniref:Zinc-finger homeodomain protein 4-like n=1 Tax=Canna indica TaxID=4628 RepID=A0AAQ3K449_9LILI|nr:zinc-finger homeodomain protein 4-like [Canna indica]